MIKTSLKKLQNLKELDLGDNQIQDLRPLSGLYKLEVLRLSQNKVHDIEPIFELPNLLVLEIWGNKLNENSEKSVKKLNKRQIKVD